MILTIRIWICKIVTKICHLFKKDGSVFPGSLVFKHDHQILWKVKYPEKVAVITGSSGKSSTVNMVAHILESSGKKVVWNKYGSNAWNAIATTILNNTSSFTHKVKADIVLLEIDERHIKGLFKPGTISHLLITNITRDQPIRNFHPDVIYGILKDTIEEGMHLIINADDPVLDRFKYVHKGKISTFGINKNKYSLMTTPSYAIDASYCPMCHTKLKYDYYHYGHLGGFTCPNCDFKRGTPDYVASDVDLKKCSFKINGEQYNLNKNVFFAVYYTLCSYSLASTLGISSDIIKKEINEDMMEPYRMNHYYEIDNRRIELMEPKNENSLSYLQPLNYISSEPGKKSLIIGFEKVSRRYPYKDMSWLWDINFELLNNKDIEKIFLIGRFKYDIGVRINYAGIDTEKLVFIDDYDTLIDTIKKESNGTVYALVGDDVKARIDGILGGAK